MMEDKWARCEKCRASGINSRLVVYQKGTFMSRSSMGHVDLSHDVYYVINSKMAPTRIAIIQALNRAVQLCKVFRYY